MIETIFQVLVGVLIGASLHWISSTNEKVGDIEFLLREIKKELKDLNKKE